MLQQDNNYSFYSIKKENIVKFQSADGTSGERNDSAFASVDIADFASLEENERRSPTPEPTISREAANQRQTPPKVIMNYKISH